MEREHGCGHVKWAQQKLNDDKVARDRLGKGKRERRGTNAKGFRCNDCCAARYKIQGELEMNGRAGKWGTSVCVVKAMQIIIRRHMQRIVKSSASKSSGVCVRVSVFMEAS
jgi:hypothetical protein